MILSEETVDLLNPAPFGDLPLEEYEKFQLKTGIVFKRMGKGELGRDWAYALFFYPDTYHEDQVGSALRGEVFDERYFYEGFRDQN